MKIFSKNIRSGFTLIEVIITIVLVGIFMTAGLNIFINPGSKSTNVENILIGESLAEERIEILMSKNYSVITSEAQTNFTGDFALFSWKTIVNYATPGNLDSISGTDAGYKRIRVQIMHPTFQDYIQLETIKGNF